MFRTFPSFILIQTKTLEEMFKSMLNEEKANHESKRKELENEREKRQEIEKEKQVVEMELKKSREEVVHPISFIS